MYLRYTTRKKDGKVHRSWRLVRSVRIGRRVIQQTVAHLGELDEAGRLRARALARALIGAPEQADLFDDGTRDQTIGVRPKGVRIENGRHFGNVYLALALWRGCRLDEFAIARIPAGKEEVPWEKMAAVLVAARLCEPFSELHIAEDWYRRTALGDLLQLSDVQVNKDRLYRALDRLLPHKAALEAHLSKRVGELFAVDNEVLLYDVTSTYFEGEAAANPQAQRGDLRDHRPDCKQVCIALVVTFDGFPLGYEVFPGNTHDATTVRTIVETDGSASRRGGPGVDHGPRHGQRRERRLAARHRAALHPGHAEVGTRKMGTCAGREEPLAPDPRRHRGEAVRGARRGRADLPPMPLAGPHRQAKGDARALQRAYRAGAGD